MALPNIKRIVISNSRSAGNYVRFSTSGLIKISANAVEALNIVDGDKAVFFQDQDNKETWYLAVGNQGDYVLRTSKSNTEDKTRFFGNKPLKELIFKSNKISAKYASLWLADEPMVVEGKKLWKLNLKP